MDEAQYELFRKHLPIADGETEPYWRAAREGKLLVPRCSACDRAFWYPRLSCPRCWSDRIEWTEASGRGTIYSYTVIAHNDVPPFRDWLPYVVALVDLEEGVRMVTNVVGCEPRDLRVGLPVEVVFERIDDEITLPKFRLTRLARQVSR